MRPSWLEVEKATIFLMSFWVRAQVAANSEESAPRHKQIVEIRAELSIRKLKRMRRKMPATTIVLEWRSAETGVGPSIAAGSQQWSPNCADFPVAANTRPKAGRVTSECDDRVDSCSISQVPKRVASQARLRIKAASPTRL